ncbi:MAG: hypothetical protein WA161_14130 [Pseudomonas sp.]|uniref:hypothetical protein n=1 Tax=Pseudomonas sp. TaxID=306 RepID=UPI003BB7EDC3
MSKIEDQSRAIKQRNAVENIGGICVIASREHMEAVGQYIDAIPGPKTRADAQFLFEMWKCSAEHEFIVFGIFTNHTGISGSIAADWENARMFVMSLKVRLDELAEKTAGGHDSHWVYLVTEEQQRELAVLLAE